MDHTSREQYIASLQTSPPSGEAECSICYSAWDEQNTHIVSTYCGHVYHEDCLTTWFDSGAEGSNNLCPHCRAVCFEPPAQEEGNEVQEDLTPDRDPDGRYRLAMGANEAAYTLLNNLNIHFCSLMMMQLFPPTLGTEYGIILANMVDANRFQVAALRVLNAMRTPAFSMIATQADVPGMPRSAEARVRIFTLILHAHILQGFLELEYFSGVMDPFEWADLITEFNLCRDACRDAAWVMDRIPLQNGAPRPDEDFLENVFLTTVCGPQVRWVWSSDLVGPDFQQLDWLAFEIGPSDRLTGLEDFSDAAVIMRTDQMNPPDQLDLLRTAEFTAHVQRVGLNARYTLYLTCAREGQTPLDHIDNASDEGTREIKVCFRNGMALLIICTSVAGMDVDME